jgi:hypothetical protein
VFTGSDGFTATVPLSDIWSDNQSIIAVDSAPDGSMRDVIPSQYYAEDWVFDLSSIQVE